MKNEIKIIIFLSVIIVSLSSFCVFREFNQARKNREYQENITALETTTKELRDKNTKFRTENEKIKRNLISIESDYSELEKRNTESLEIIRELENARGELTEENQGFDEDLTELEKLLAEFLID